MEGFKLVADVLDIRVEAVRVVRTLKPNVDDGCIIMTYDGENYIALPADPNTIIGGEGYHIPTRQELNLPDNDGYIGDKDMYPQLIISLQDGHIVMVVETYENNQTQIIFTHTITEEWLIEILYNAMCHDLSIYDINCEPLY